MEQETKTLEQCVIQTGVSEDEYCFIELDCEHLSKYLINNKEFERGIKDYSYVCGAITALCNSGLKPSEAIDYVVNVDTIKHNLEVTKIGANATVESAKYASIKSDLENI